MQRVKNFAAFLGRSPDTASFEDVRRYQLHLATSGAGVPTLNQSVSTLRFFFKITLGRADIVNHTQFIHVPRKLPVEVACPAGSSRPATGAQKNTMLKSRHVDIVNSKVRPIERSFDRLECGRLIHLVHLGDVKYRL